MLTLCATTLLGLLAVPANEPAAPSPTLSAAPPAAAAPFAAVTQGTVPLAPVPHETSCAFFDEGEWRARLLDPDLAARESAYTELLNLARRHSSIRVTINAWAHETSGLELAWTARLAIRELNHELQQAIADVQRMRVEQLQARPWQQDYQRQILVELGLDPDQYRISGTLRLSPEDLERLGALGGGETTIPRTRSAQGQPVLGVACDESLTDRVMLTRVVPGSIADAVGLVAGDRLLSIGEHALTGPADVSEAMHDWGARAPSAPDALEIRAIDGRTGESKVRVWVPSPEGR